MIKITKTRLNILFSRAKNHLINENAGELDPQQFIAQCWIKAVLAELEIKADVEYPKRLFYESVDED
jgi:hypothetical protein